MQEHKGYAKDLGFESKGNGWGPFCFLTESDVSGPCLEYSLWLLCRERTSRGAGLEVRGQEAMSANKEERPLLMPRLCDVPELNVTPACLPPCLHRTPQMPSGRVFQVSSHWEGLSSLPDRTLEDRILKIEI